MPRANRNDASVLDETTVRELASLDAAGALVVTLTLDCDGRRFPRKGDYETHLQNLLRNARIELERTDAPRDAARAAREDLDRIHRFVTREFERRDARGLAIFACEPLGLWRTYRLPRAIGSRIVLDRHPHVLRLEEMLSRDERLVTAMIARDRARLFATRLGQTAERGEVSDAVPGRHDQGGWSQARFQRHIGELAQHHYRNIIEALISLGKREPFDRLVLAGPEDSVADFEKALPPALADKVAARLSLPASATTREVHEAATAAAEALERDRAAELAARVREEAAAGRLGVTGVEPTLSALVRSRADVLVLAGDGAVVPGHRCPGCGHLAQRDGECPVCGTAMKAVEDLLEEMVDEAVRRGCRVVTARPGSIPEGIGALLRF